MGKNKSDFEKYLDTMKYYLKTSQDVKEKICAEVKQTLEDKYRENLGCGYDNSTSIRMTLEGFEEPEKLAKDFNKVYKEMLEMKNNKENILVLAARAFSDIFLTGGLTPENCKAVLDSQSESDEKLKKIHLK